MERSNQRRYKNPSTAEIYAKDRGKWRRLVNEKWAKPYVGCSVKESKDLSISYVSEKIK